MTLGRLLMHVGWTVLCPGAGQGTAGKRALAAAWAVAGLACAIAITWTFWAVVAAFAVRVASAADAALRLRGVARDDEDRNLPLYASLVAVAGFVFFQLTTDRFAIPSDSMTPAIAVGDSVLVTTLATTPRRGDVIVFAHPCDGITHIKRAVAIAGDTVEVRCGALYINGVTHERAGDSAKDFPRLDGVVTGCAGRAPAGEVVHVPNATACAPQAHFVVPDDSVFVLGDNRATSIDSRAWGVVPAGNVKGRAIGIVWPLAHAGRL